MTKNAERRTKFAAINADLQDRQERNLDIDRSAHKTGHHGDRSGWAKSIELETGKYSPEERQWREAVLHRDGHACVFCGSTENLEADHIQPKALYPDLKFTVSNGRTLCHPCHVGTDTYGVKIKRVVEVKVEDPTI